GAGARLAERRLADAYDRLKDFFSIVLHPSCVGIVLTDFAISAASDASGGIEHQNGSAGSSLVDCEHQVRQVQSSSTVESVVFINHQTLSLHTRIAPYGARSIDNARGDAANRTVSLGEVNEPCGYYLSQPL